jgi:hypothetical protein
MQQAKVIQMRPRPRAMHGLRGITDAATWNTGPDGSVSAIDPSGASYSQGANGAWFYADEIGYQISGDAQGNTCDNVGNCTGGWAPPTAPKQTDNTLLYLGFGAFALLLVMMSKK